MAHGLNCSAARGIEPVSPALAGGFLTTVPTGRSRECILTAQLVCPEPGEGGGKSLEIR